MRKLFLMASFGVLTACVPTEEQPTQSRPAVTFTRDAASGIAAYRRVAARVEPVAEQICRSIHPSQPRNFCDFRVNVDNDPRQPPNAYQSIGKDGRPVITFNVNMLRTFRNDHEIAFVFGHEAGHQIATHINRAQGNQALGALILGGVAIAIGGDVSAGADLGAAIGGRAYSKKFELQADTIAAHIADRAGYNAAIGAKTFDRTGGSSALFATHPPSSQRKAQVAQTVTVIETAKSQGRRAPVAW